MRQETLLTLLLVFLTVVVQAQDFRTIDGSLNNAQNPEWGAHGAELQQITTLGFRDGISLPGGTNRPNPRLLSNALFAQDSVLTDKLNLSDFTWVFGQFIDHDITLVGNDPTENASIPVDFRDPFMNPAGTFTAFIPMSRSAAMAGTGTSVSNPRKYSNEITAFIDGSGVYGSDSTRAAWLRTFSEGKLKTSAGDLMPFNTITGELGDPIDSNAPGMDNENPFAVNWFIAGDARANENALLASFHILFVREHNRKCVELAIKNPNWTDEELYQHARKWVGALIQTVVYKEWLPTMGIHLDAYSGYDPTINPNISNVFSAAAFRLGHTLLNSSIMRLDNNGNELPEGNIRLKDAFFQPLVILDVGGVDPYFKGMAVQVEQEMDSKIVDDVRNFLFGPPGSGAGGLDLAAININRGRERGLPDFNTTRQNFGLPAYPDCQAICADSTVYNALQNLYGDVNEIDPWVGMLAETHMEDALFGETIMTIMMQQFGDLRDGDRYFYKNDPLLTEEDKLNIGNTTLRDIIMRNTNIDIMQDNVFNAMPHDSVCSAPSSRLALGGQVLTENGDQVKNVAIQLDGYQQSMNESTSDSTGAFGFDNVLACESYELRPIKNDDFSNGVSTYDLVLISKHILGIEPLNSPYKMIAADVNKSASITGFDMVEIRKLILELNDNFQGNTAWRFIDEAYEFDNPLRPLSETWPERITIASLTDTASVQFVAIKTGDVNGNARVNELIESEDRGAVGTLTFDVVDEILPAGEVVPVHFRAKDMKTIAGYQFTLDYDETRLEVLDIQAQGLNDLTAANFAHFEADGIITSSWNGSTSVDEETILFSLLVRAHTEAQTSDLLDIHSDYTEAEAYNQALDFLDVSLAFNTTSSLAHKGFELYQNRPNPFNANTEIGFTISEAAPVSLRVFDLAGKELRSYKGAFESGYNTFEIKKEDLPAAGVLYYQVETPFGSATRKMVVF